MNDVKKIIYNCKKATLLIEKKQMTPLTLGEKMELKLHLAGCSVCRTFERQSILINNHIKSLFQSAPKSESKLNDQFKSDLQNKIKEKLKRP
ncbi:MAG: hypothetical protein ABI480_12505 [Chitinophagaceae bacterium]